MRREKKYGISVFRISGTGIKGKMKKSLRKKKSIYKRDVWDNTHIYWFFGLATNRIKYKLEHLPKKDLRMRKALEEVLKWRHHRKEMSEP